MSADKPSPRSAIGMFGLIIGLMLYAFLAASIGDLLIGTSLIIQTAYYILAGLLWIWPAKWLMSWMGGKNQ